MMAQMARVGGQQEAHIVSVHDMELVTRHQGQLIRDVDNMRDILPPLFYVVEDTFIIKSLYHEYVY